jgi:hypothetical protein
MAKIQRQNAASANTSAETEQDDEIDEEAQAVIADLASSVQTARVLFELNEGERPTPEMVFGVYDRAFAVYDEE